MEKNLVCQYLENISIEALNHMGIFSGLIVFSFTRERVKA